MNQVPLSTNNLERSDRPKKSRSTFNLERSERFERFFTSKIAIGSKDLCERAKRIPRAMIPTTLTSSEAKRINLGQPSISSVARGSKDLFQPITSRIAIGSKDLCEPFTSS